MNCGELRRLAADCGFELAGATRPYPVPDAVKYQDWAARGLAGEMRYLTDHRAEIRGDPVRLLPSVRTIVCVGKLYNSPYPYSTAFREPELGWIARYAWGEDYHDVLRSGLERLAHRLGSHEYRICVDTAPLLERSYARQAGLGWIGKNTCLINQQRGSWFFLGELLTSLEIEPGEPPPDRCGSCTRCIDACPTGALVPHDGGIELDARLCISYYTIEFRAAVPETARSHIGNHIFGCDVCQDVCPWNADAPVTTDPVFQPAFAHPPLDRMAALTESEFRAMFGNSPLPRAKYRGFLRNVAIAMGNSGKPEFKAPLERLAAYDDSLIAEHASWALDRLTAS
jgi:epoxyqueuosine reductase